jgi:hypothetical protein
VFVLFKKLITDFRKLFKRKSRDQDDNVEPFNYPLF